MPVHFSAIPLKTILMRPCAYSPLRADARYLQHNIGANTCSRGRSGDEIEDEGFNLSKVRRRSNSSVDYAKEAFKTKFEAIEQEPVFEEELHGDGGKNHYPTEAADHLDGADLDKQSTSDSSVGSIEEEATSGGKM